jgi:thioredoxin 1
MTSASDDSVPEAGSREILKRLPTHRIDMSQSEEKPTEPVHVENDEHLQELVGQYDVTLVDFWAEWCGPCKMLEPTVEELAAESEAVVLKVDIDEHQDLARDEGIRSVPTLQFYQDGEQVERVIGVQDKSNLEAIIEQLSA